MKTRIISALIGLVVLFAVILKFNTMILNLAVSTVLIIAADEILNTFKLKSNKLFCAVSYVFSGIIPFLDLKIFGNIIPAVIFIYVFLTLLIMLKYHSSLKIETVGFASAFNTAVVMSGTCIIYLRDIYGASVGFFAILIVLAGAWMSDTGAYFSGFFFGKHKMAPLISPKKTVEGAVGGLIVCTVSEILFSMAYAAVLSKMGITAQVDYMALALISPFISLVSIVGDLSFSIVKRQTGIKDFGKIMPGHGGILDRFDSVLMVIPVVYIIFSIRPLITIL